MIIHGIKTEPVDGLIQGIALLLKLITCFVVGVESALLLFRVLNC